MRTTVASSRIATVRPTPIWLTVAIGAAAKETKTAAMIAAAPVITPAVFSRPKRDRGAVVAALGVVLAHAGEEEDGVVDREAEGDAEDRGRADGVDVGVAAERVAVGDLADEGDDADRGGDREQVEDDGEGGEQRRAQEGDEHQEGDEDDRADDERQARLGLRAVVVEDGGAAAEAGAEAGAPCRSSGDRSEGGGRAPRAGGVEAGVGDDQVAGGLPPPETSITSAASERSIGSAAVERGDDEVAGVEEAG